MNEFLRFFYTCPQPSSKLHFCFFILLSVLKVWFVIYLCCYAGFESLLRSHTWSHSFSNWFNPPLFSMGVCAGTNVSWCMFPCLHKGTYINLTPSQVLSFTCPKPSSMLCFSIILLSVLLILLDMYISRLFCCIYRGFESGLWCQLLEYVPEQRSNDQRRCINFIPQSSLE